MMRLLVPCLAVTALATDVPDVTLNNGVQMPAIAAGSWEYDSDTAEQSVAAALEVGYRHIDTAHDYCGDATTGDCKGASNQIGVGKAIAASGISRDEIFLTTKVPGCGSQGISRVKCGDDSVAAAVGGVWPCVEVVASAFL